MSEKARVRLGAYLLFALLLLTLPVSLLVVHQTAKRHAPQWVATATGVKWINADYHQQGIDHVRKAYGLSTDGAMKLVHQTEVATKSSLNTSREVPYGTQIDYYDVNAKNVPQTARLSGSAVVTRAADPEAQAYVQQVRDMAAQKKDGGYLPILERDLKKGFVMIPTAFTAPAATGASGRIVAPAIPGVPSANGVTKSAKAPVAVHAKATTTHYRIAVVATKLPGWHDVAPRSDNDTDPNDNTSMGVNYADQTPFPALGTAAEFVYRAIPTVTPFNKGWNYANIAQGGTDPQNEVDAAHPFGSIWDTPGGPCPAGIPQGILPADRWDYMDAGLSPATPVRDTNLRLQDFYFNSLYDQSLTSGSISNFYYQETHGNVRLDGDRSDVIGWLTSAHQTNRYGYQVDGGNQAFIFPGTPVIRPVPDASIPLVGGLPMDNVIVRASMYEAGVTVLFSRPRTTPLTNGEITLQAYTSQDTITDNTNVPISIGVNSGIVNLTPPAGAAAPVMDPYDGRRWYIPIAGWTYPKRAFSTTAPYPETFPSTATVWTGQDNAPWSIAVAGYQTLDDPAVAGAAHPYKRNQRRGCPSLSNTIIVASDIKIARHEDATGTTTCTFPNRPFARLKSLDYYTQCYVLGNSFQLKHLRVTGGTGETDDIAGGTYNDYYGGPGTENGGDRVPRPAPFDHNDGDSWSGGYWPNGGGIDVNGLTQGTNPLQPNLTSTVPGNHTEGAYMGDVANVLLDNGITLAGYDVVIHVNADGATGQTGEGGASAGGGFQPNSGDLCWGEANGPAAHEFGHALCGFGDLYDNDLYANATVPPPVPAYHMCMAMDQLSVMAHGGRIDAFHEAAAGFVPVTAITQDTLGVQVPGIEGLLRDPVLIKVPGNPYDLKMGTDPSAWKEYFLLENRSQTGQNGGKAPWTDNVAPGLYIYHIDTRGLALNNPNQAGGQRDDNLLSVIIEQANGLHDLEYSDDGGAPKSGLSWAQTYLGFPFGAGTLVNASRFWQFPYLNGDKNDLGGNVAVPNDGSNAGSTPTSYSHGGAAANGKTLAPSSTTDSFARIVNISTIGANMTADVYVQPAEVVAYGKAQNPVDAQNSLISNTAATISSASRDALGVVTVTTTAAHGFNAGEGIKISGLSDATLNGIYAIASTPTPTTFTYRELAATPTVVAGDATTKATPGVVYQGQQNVPVMLVTLDNQEDTTPGHTDNSRMSTQDVYIDNMYVLQSGTANISADVSAVKLYADPSDTPTGFDPATDALLATGTIDSTPGSKTYGYAVFTGLGYRVPLGKKRTLYIAYDIAPEAQTNPWVTVGAEFTDPTKIVPRLPGTVQIRQRTATQYSFGSNWFPQFTHTAVIHSSPDRLVLTPDVTNLPTNASQGQTEVPVVKLTAAVNPGGLPRTQGSVRVDSIKVDQTGTGSGLSDLANCELYLDNGDGVFDATADGAYTKAQLKLPSVPTSSFTPGGTGGLANFTNLNLQIDSGAPRVFFLVVNVSATATVGKDIRLTLQFPTPGPQPQAGCFVQLINSPTEVDGNKDYVDFTAANWPVNSTRLSIIVPNLAPKAPIAPFAPSAPAQISTVTPTLSWNMPVPPDPDVADTLATLHYEIQLADNAGFNTPTNGTTADGILTWDVPLASALTVNQDYWWKVRAVDSHDAVSPWSVTQTFKVVANRAPNRIDVGFTPTGDITTRTPGTLKAAGGDSDPTSPISWTKATDPDTSDTQASLKYVLQIDDNNDFSSPVHLRNIGAAPGWEEWRVGLVDATGAVVNAAISHADQSTYTVVPTDGLTWGTTYYYRVAAMDVAGAVGAWSPRQLFHPVQDRSPNSPIAAFAPFNDNEVTTANPVLTWNMPSVATTGTLPDPDPTDPIATLHYEVQLKEGTPPTDADLTNGVGVFAPHVTAVGTQQWIVTENQDGTPGGLLDNGHYFWRVRAVDDEANTGDLTNNLGRSDWTAVQSFYVNLVNNPPNAPTAGFTPSNGQQTNDATPVLSWYAATDPDHTDTAATLHYVVALSKDPTFATVDYQYTSTDGVVTVTATTLLTDKMTWYWRVKTVDDEGAESGWSTIVSFKLDTNNQPPTLSAASVVPLYGDMTTLFQLYVTYTDAENDPEGTVTCEIDNPSKIYVMSKVDPTDNNARNGIQYVVGIPASDLGLGLHNHQFYCDGGTTGAKIVSLPTPSGFDLGPVVTSPSSVAFTDAGGAPTAIYEEGQPVYLKVDDAGHSASVTVTVTEARGDSETVVLTETAAGSHVFTGSLATQGKAGASNDGKLNAIGGPSGNRLTVTYRDAYDTLNPTPDISTATAMLFDTVAPAGVNKKLVVTSGADGRTASLDWGSYDEVAEVDVAGYHVYYVPTTEFTSTTGLTPVATVPAGTKTYQMTGLVPNKTYWFAVVAFDEVPNELNSVVARKLITRDINAPTISGQAPALNATEVARDTTISFYLDDLGVGVDRSTLQVNLTQNGDPIAHNAFVFEGDKNHLKVTTTPTDLLLWNGVINVGVDVKDFDGNELTVSDWNFSCVTDTEKPTLDQQSPAPAAKNVPVSTSIAFHLKDNRSGIDPATIQVQFDGQDVSGNLSLGGTPLDTTVLYSPANGLSYSASYTVVVTARDVAGNLVGPITWSFSTVKDSSSVSVDQFDPARDAVDVPVETNISLRLTDPQAGIDRGTLRMWVQGTEVTGTGNLTITQTPDPADHPTTVYVKYDPTDDLPYSTDIRVRIQVKDGVGNVADVTYKFRTVDAPTYSIIGAVKDTDGAALPGVTVTAGGKTTTTDGTGGFMITGLLAGTYTVTPTRAQYVFAPAHTDVTLGPDDANSVNFTGTLLTYALHGKVTEGGTGLAGVTLSCNGQTAISGADGTYVLTGLPNGQYTVTVALPNYHFQPTSRAVQINSADVNGVDFQAIADTFSISGTIKDTLGNRLLGVEVSAGDKIAITNDAGYYIISGLRVDAYTVTPRKTGYTFNPPSQTLTLDGDKVNIDFIALVELSNSFPAGWNFIGFPGTPADANATHVFGTVQCFRWNPDAVPPQYLAPVNDPTLEVVKVRAGRGYFVNYNSPTTVRVAGQPTDPSRTTSIGLSEGWNMIANPLSMPTKWSRFVPSQTDGVRPFAFVLDAATGSYKMVSSDPSLGADRDSLIGWEGAWVRAVSSGVSLLVSPGSGTAGEAVSKPAQADLNGGWFIPVMARAGNRGDYTSLAGVVPGSDGQHSIENPPTPPHTVDVYFTTSSGQRLAHDVRSQSGPQTFDFTVACGVPDADVTVSLPDLSRVPASQQILLIDKETGKALYARTMSSYSYHSQAEGAERKFQLVVSPRTIGALAVTATTAAAKGDGVVLTYSVTKGCQVNIRVLNLAGRAVKMLASNKSVVAGVQSELWNLTSEGGTRVPAGTYLLQIDAVTDSGQSVRGITQVQIGR